VAFAAPTPSLAQDEVVLKPKSGVAAFGLSVLLPGLGHRYVNGGSWGGAGTVFVTADIGLWLGLVASVTQENHAVESYTNLVARSAGNTLDGKSRSLELSIGNHDSSSEFIDELLRSRQWDRLEGAEDPSNQWEWESTSDRVRYIELRDDADAADRRTKAIIAGLVINRLISGITAVLKSRGTRAPQQLQQSFSAGLGYSPYADLPVAHFSVRF